MLRGRFPFSPTAEIRPRGGRRVSGTRVSCASVLRWLNRLGLSPQTGAGDPKVGGKVSTSLALLFGRADLGAGVSSGRCHGVSGGLKLPRKTLESASFTPAVLEMRDFSPTMNDRHAPPPGHPAAAPKPSLLLARNPRAPAPSAHRRLLDIARPFTSCRFPAEKQGWTSRTIAWWSE